MSNVILYHYVDKMYHNVTFRLREKDRIALSIGLRKAEMGKSDIYQFEECLRILSAAL